MLYMRLEDLFNVGDCWLVIGWDNYQIVKWGDMEIVLMMLYVFFDCM